MVCFDCLHNPKPISNEMGLFLFLRRPIVNTYEKNQRQTYYLSNHEKHKSMLGSFRTEENAVCAFVTKFGCNPDYLVCDQE